MESFSSRSLVVLAVNVDKAPPVWCFELANKWCRCEDVLVVGVDEMTRKDFDAGHDLANGGIRSVT